MTDYLEVRIGPHNTPQFAIVHGVKPRVLREDTATVRYEAIPDEFSALSLDQVVALYEARQLKAKDAT